VSARVRTAVLALAAALALADASIVTLALPELLTQLDTGVEGVAAVLGVYTAVLAVALLPAWSLTRRLHARWVGAAGLLVFCGASILCGEANTLNVLLLGRAIQALGAAAGLVAGFALITTGPAQDLGRRLWPLAAIIGTATGPALGGALTQAFDWRAIFLVQAPIALAGAVACLTARGAPEDFGAAHAERPKLVPSLALALLSAALTAVLFLLVLLLVAGWSTEPLAAAAVVSAIPIAAFIGSKVGGDARGRAAAGSLLVGGGVLALAFLPDSWLGWTIVPQLVAGFGMGLALPALAGSLLPEREPHEAALLLTIRHAGIAVALLVLAPIASNALDESVARAKLRGIAIVLDADLPPQPKLELAPKLISGVETDDPRDGLKRAIDRERPQFSGDDLIKYDEVARDEDDTLVLAVAEAFKTPFLLTGAFALLAALLLLPGAGRRRLLAASAVIAAATPLGYAALHSAIAPEPVKIADPCKGRDLPDSGGLMGFLQKGALKLLDRAACDAGSSREELVLAIADDDEAKKFEKKYGKDPRKIGGLLVGAIRG
jgi:predicted MFS family arabinose efflux permease